MRIYVAGPYVARESLLQTKSEIEAHGHEVTSRWLLGSHDDLAPIICATDDLEDIERADALILFLDRGPGSRGGMYVELGYAIAKGKKVILVGERTNVFTWLAPTGDLAEALARL